MRALEPKTNVLTRKQKDLEALLSDVSNNLERKVTGMNIPRVGCGAAILRDGRLLLVKRRRNPEAHHWGLPGGKVDPFETVPAAVAREIHEEIGLSITPQTLLCVVDQIDQAQGQHWVAPVYLVEDWRGLRWMRCPLR